MNLFKKASPWVVATLMAASSAVAQSNNSCPPKPKCCEETKPLQLVAGYNAPARVEVKGCWDVYAQGSFTYLQAFESSIEPGAIQTTDSATNRVQSTIESQKFGYKPGFKVALGMNFDWDNWDSMVQYAWFRGSDVSSTNLDPANVSNVQFVPTQAGLIGSDFYGSSQKWKLHMDLLDWELGRSYYVGTKLTFRPHFGARAAWIRQNLNRTLSNSNGINIFNRLSHSWAVGPRAGVNTNWNFGDGFRIFGNGGADILFTQYTRAKSDLSTRSNNGDVTAEVNVSQRSINTLRTHMDVELGLGWGTYFDCNNWHIDLSAGYGFQVFFEQNMFREFGLASSTLPNGNLYMHGLTTTVRLDF